MKKLLCVALLASGVAFGGGMDLNGIISNVDNANKTITINGTVVQILPQTKIELDDCGVFGNDVLGKFSDLKNGDFVEAEVYPNSSQFVGEYATKNAGKQGAPMYVAEEVQKECVKNRAY